MAVRRVGETAFRTSIVVSSLRGIKARRHVAKELESILWKPCHEFGLIISQKSQKFDLETCRQLDLQESTINDVLLSECTFRCSNHIGEKVIRRH
jgi:hypothetical protein